VNNRKSYKAGASAPEEVAHSGLVPQLGMMLRALWAASVRNVLVLLATSVFLVIVVTAYGQIRLNRWNKPFYDALSHRDVRQFLVQLGVFAIIAGALLALNVAQRWLTEMLKLKLREGLTLDLIEIWMRAASGVPAGKRRSRRSQPRSAHA